jgi:DNA-3-methyladenine glycosylase
MKTISRNIFKKDALTIAKFLLGKVIEYNGCSGVIVETEAYMSDPASHAYKITPRSEIMLKTYGYWYIYFVYGMYYCLNITTNYKEPGAVLIRSLEPLKGIDKMKEQRKTDKVENLTSGPGKLCQAFNINTRLNNTKINDKIKLYNYKEFNDTQIVASKRIGVSKGNDLDWRFYIKNNKFVSRF